MCNLKLKDEEIKYTFTGDETELHGMIHRVLAQNRLLVENVTWLYNSQMVALERQKQALVNTLHPQHVTTTQELCM
jgi:hypothetical protein